MPAGPWGEKRPGDVAGCAVRVAQIATGVVLETQTEGQVNARKGGHNLGEFGMSQGEANTQGTSERAEEHANMLEMALARPGIREVMEVYHGWIDRKKGIDVHRWATKEAQQITTTNYTTAR